jgi:predicted permease
MSTLWQDIRYSLRTLTRSRGFTVVVVLILTVGIGATTAVFSVVSGVLLHPLPYQDPDRLVMLFSTSESFGRVPTSRLNFLDWQRQSRTFEDMAISRFARATYRHQEGAERVAGVCVSPNLCPLLGLKPSVGRTFRPEETWPNHHYVILGDSFWRRYLGGRESVLGQMITLLVGKTEAAYTVIGIMPPGVRFLNTAWSFGAFTGANAQVDFWIPVDEDLPTGRGASDWEVVARLKPDVSVKEAQAEMDGIAQRVARQYSDPARAPSVKVVPLRVHLLGETRPLVLLGAGGALFVLLIACANVMNLMHVRGLAHRRELALRATLGAGRLRLVRQVVTESILLAACGGAFGLLLAWLGTRVFQAIAPHTIPDYEQVSVNAVVFAFAVGMALLAGIAIGMPRALEACRLELHEMLKEGQRSATMGYRRQRLAAVLVTTQVFLSVILLISAGLLINSLSRLLLVEPGYRTRDILTMKIDNTRRENCDSILRRVRALPGVRAAAMVSGLPLSGDNTSRGTAPPQGYQGNPERVQVYGHIVTPGYFRLMGIPLRAGRDFTEDGHQGPTAVVINERLAQLFWPNEDPVGKQFQYDMVDGPVEVIGVVRNVKSLGLDAEVELEVFLPWQHMADSIRNSRLVVATEIDPQVLIEPLIREVRATDRYGVITEIRTMDEMLEETLAVRRFLAVVLSFFSCAALLLAGFGVYGMMAHSIRQRTHEIGIRMALGATTGKILKAVVTQGLRLTLIGIGLGLGGAVVLTRTLSGFLYHISPTDPLTFTCVSAFMVMVALTACYLPAHRAAKIDPMKALRYE